MAATFCHWHGNVPIYTTTAKAERIRGELVLFTAKLCRDGHVCEQWNFSIKTFI